MQTIEERAKIKIGCPEETAFRSGFLTLLELAEMATGMLQCEYRH